LIRVCAINHHPAARCDRAIPADLETILLKAMAKSPGERYESAKDLADDIRRFPEGKAVLARRAGIVDRAGKWARRHCTTVAAARVAMAAVLVASVAITLQLLAAGHVIWEPIEKILTFPAAALVKLRRAAWAGFTPDGRLRDWTIKRSPLAGLPGTRRASRKAVM
jgi:hypothetical protein